jgi:DNA mismatch endonuclease Vsr
MDKLTPEQRQKNMQAVRSTGSEIERLLAKAIWSRGLRYRKNDKSVFGKPDLAMKRYKIAIFVDSEFWHGKDWKTRKNDHKSNIKFWHKKIERNIERDREVTDYLVKNGWIVLRFWGEEVKKNLRYCVNKIENAVNEVRKENQYRGV